MALSIAVRDDLVQTGITEDGEPALARCFYLFAEDATGARWVHDYNHVAPRLTEDAVAGHFEVLRARVEAHLARGGKLDPAHWTEIDPAYGSLAYQGLAETGYFRAAERARDRDAGDNIPFEANDMAVDFAPARSILEARP